MKKIKKLLIGTIVVIFLFGLSHLAEGINTLENFNNSSKNVSEVNNIDVSGKLIVDYIDVGQGDSALITVNGKSMLIDAGPNESEEKVVEYIKNKNISKIEYVLGTHPHEDHIGGLDKVIENFEIGQVYLPKVSSTTKTYESVIKQINKKDLKINQAKDGVSLDLGPGVKVEMYSPGKKDYDNLNNYSSIVKITFGENSFLFTGDAEKEAEDEVLKKGYDVSSDVLKVGHHGSSTSTSNEFLDKVNPMIAIISCGYNNSYGHPNKDTIDKLTKKNVKIFRTDGSGDIEVESDGKNLSIK